MVKNESWKHVLTHVPSDRERSLLGRLGCLEQGHLWERENLTRNIEEKKLEDLRILYNFRNIPSHTPTRHPCTPPEILIYTDPLLAPILYEIGMGLITQPALGERRTGEKQDSFVQQMQFHKVAILPAQCPHCDIDVDIRASVYLVSTMFPQAVTNAFHRTLWPSGMAGGGWVGASLGGE